jgi:twitching motility protein PilT
MIDSSIFLKMMIEKGASDLHLVVGSSPQIRVDGVLTDTPFPPLNPEDSRSIAYSFLTTKQIDEFERHREIDCSYAKGGVGRFRINVFLSRGSVATAIRKIPEQAPSFEELGLPSCVREFADRGSGLILVTGVAGSGKSTTLAAMIDHINRTRSSRVITIEDPIEYVHRNKKSTISQREIGTDCDSFSAVLKRVVRQDPNVIMIGEMRDLETIRVALTLAETGHLILATLHSKDITHTISRIVDVFPADQQEQVRVQLSLVLAGVISQQLLPKKNGFGRVLAYETMRVIPAFQNLIRQNDLAQIRSLIQMHEKYQTCSMNQCLAALYRNGIVSWEETARHTTDLEELKQFTESLYFKNIF